MGMFDDIKFRGTRMIPRCLSGHNVGPCQTKSLDCELDQLIVINGRLMRRTRKHEFAGHGAHRLHQYGIVSCPKILKDHTGEVNFYGSCKQCPPIWTLTSWPTGHNFRAHPSYPDNDFTAWFGAGMMVRLVANQRETPQDVLKGLRADEKVLEPDDPLVLKYLSERKARG